MPKVEGSFFLTLTGIDNEDEDEHEHVET
ncbi:MAG: hypothetical protein QOE88_2220, partial [Verrucomicrobiota bacterium]|nr:hypothetical protein [Verrucomicrobiota bacterium]